MASPSAPGSIAHTHDAAYERRLQTDPEWAMSESAKYFEGTSRLHETLRELRRRFDAVNISYVVLGGMALTIHGYARMTEDIDVLITPAELKRLHDELVGRGYRREFEGGKNLRDTNTNVKIEFVLTGAYPGNGKVQPVSFPDPAATEPVEHEGVKYIGLAALIELKLASGMTGGPDRAKDLVDVQQLITTRQLPRAFDDKLHAHVRSKFTDLWDGLRATPKRFIRLWRNKSLTASAASVTEMAVMLERAAAELRQMQADGVVLEAGGAADDHARLATPNPDIARKYDMHEESEFFGEGDE